MNFSFPDGATPITDLSNLLIPWVRNMRELNRVEAENISQAQKKYLRKSREDITTLFTPNEFSKVHFAMFDKVWSWAGKIRESITSIGVHPNTIRPKLADFCEEVAAWNSEPIELSFLEKSARIHHRLVQIHPFENGNGRFSRMIADRYLLYWNCPFPIWPDNLCQEGGNRKQYIQALQAADQGIYEPLIHFMKNLGAKEPNICNLFCDQLFKTFMNSQKGPAKIRALIRMGEDLNKVEKNGHKLLQLIIKAKMKPKIKFEILKICLQVDMEINQRDKSGLTPFQTAVMVGDKTIAIFLRSHGAKDSVPPGIGYAKYHTMFKKPPPTN